MSNKKIIQTALQTIQLQADAISKLKGFINADFERALEAIAASNGRLVISGIGKSAIIAKKLSPPLIAQVPRQFLCTLQMPFTGI